MTVLVVDDTDSARDIATRLLRHHGLEVFQAESGADALGMLEHLNPDVILLDISMPDMDGLEVLEKLRQDPRWEDIPVVMLTAVMNEEYVRRALSLGASEYLLKAGFTAPRLLEVVKRHARRHDQSQQN